MTTHLSVGHEYHAFIAPRSTHVGQANAGVPSSPLDDRPTTSYAVYQTPISPRSFPEKSHSPALFFCIPNDPDRGTVLDTSPRILKLGLAKYATSYLF